MMRIAINTLAMRRELYGVGNYIKNLVRALSEVDGDNEYVLFASAENSCHLQGLGKNFSVEIAPANRMLRVAWEQTALPLLLKGLKIDVYHGATFVTPLVKACCHVVTVHDMTFHLVPERHSLHKRAYFRSMVQAAILRSDRVIAVSESTKRDILKIVRTDEKKICVVHHGVDRKFQPITDEEKLARIREKYDLRRKFILFVGVIEPRKNLEALADAYLADSLSGEFDLVLAGSLGWGYSTLMQKIANASAEHCIRMPGYIADGDLAALYSCATAFAYPSLYEGFGFPVLEAMACGIPVITSAVSSLPEIAGDAAILVDPHDTSALASALRRVVKDGRLRDDLSRRGRQRAQHFSWEQAARKTLEVYKRASGASPAWRSPVENRVQESQAAD
jgi:glycosyltransferase involved in cell wall biosynthesis